MYPDSSSSPYSSWSDDSFSLLSNSSRSSSPEPSFDSPPQLDTRHLNSGELRELAWEQKDYFEQCQDEAFYVGRNTTGWWEWQKEAEYHRQQMNLFNDEASNLIYNQMNRNLRPQEINLHGQYVGEAIEITTMALQVARKKGLSSLSIIVGQGRHSIGAPHLKPEVIKRVRSHNLHCEVDGINPGRLIVQIPDAWQEEGGWIEAKVSKRTTYLCTIESLRKLTEIDPDYI